MNTTTLLYLLAEMFHSGPTPICETVVLSDGLRLDHTTIVQCAAGTRTNGHLWFLESGETWDTRLVPLSSSPPIATTDAACQTTWEHVYGEDGSPRYATPLIGTNRYQDKITILSRTATHPGVIGECQASFNNSPLPSFVDGEAVMVLGAY